MFVAGLRRAGANPTRESLLRGLEGLTNFDAGGFRVSFGAGKHDGSTYVELGVVDRRGKLIQ